ncbi:helix-turn-helix transcriptional regulator [Mycolicibacter longobardus]|uniref:HTH luxR-type domain-containing protein n=1 Tax=Mycolicibacter longobardus TaxID=1108812 RepID=A0A1X1YD55_9MYCO|nr:LuxR C-terminal-related transcriptional regulator [Mycolicibacter longobardus]MCV7385405.1 hypothetical protein [Mycolicibacter longobardus]ORW08985.1 hypothetical protein AWC16_17970 [Mycolicibacter longobardus]
MLTIDGFSRVVHAIYATAVGDRSWDLTLDEIATAMDGQGCALIVTGDHNAIVHRSAGSDPGCVVTYNQHYCHLDPAPAAIDEVSTGHVVSRQQMFADDSLRGTEFYNDWAVPNGHGDCTYSVLARRGASTSWLCVTAQAGTDPFSTPQRVRVMSALVPHLQHVIALRARLSEMDRRSGELIAALEAASDGMAIVGDNGRVSYLNPAACALLNRGDGLNMTAAMLRSSVAVVDNAIARAVRAALDRDGPPTAGRVVVPRPAGGSPYVLRVVPVSTAETPTALVVVADPDRAGPPTVAGLIRDFGLTRTEAEVARRVLDGAGLRPIAEERCVSITTIRTHLKHIFEKTGTHRQGELIRLLLGARAASSPATEAREQIRNPAR